MQREYSYTHAANIAQHGRGYVSAHYDWDDRMASCTRLELLSQRPDYPAWDKWMDRHLTTHDNLVGDDIGLKANSRYSS